jgi:uncharacterized membrane protein YdbT with pleckstrin-like domain
MDGADIIGSDETIVEVVRRHWINVVPVMAAFLLISLMAIVGFYFLGRDSYKFNQPSALPVATVALLALLVLGLLLAYMSYMVYCQNRLIMTTKNLYQVTQNGLFSRKVSQFSLERLQDVSAAQNGMLASMLDFGDVTIETAGEEENFVFRQAAKPRALAGRIMNCHKRATGELASAQAGAPN